MNKMRRTVLVLLAVLMVVPLLFFGCANGDYGLSKTSPVSITIWHYYNGAQQQMFDELVADFNETVGAEKGIVVEVYSQGSVDELSEKVMDAVEQKVGAQAVPDIFAAYADTAYEINRRGLAADLGKYLTSEEKQKYVSAYLEEGQIDEKSIVLFPIAKSTEVFIVNQTDWEKFSGATGASEEDFATWEGITKLAKQYYEWTDALTPEPDDGKAFFGRDAMANYLLIGSMQLGTELFSVENGAVTFQVDRDVMRKLWDNYYIPYISGYFTAKGRFRSDDAKTGDVIALVCSTSGAAYFPSEVTTEDGSSYPITSKVYPLPGFKGTEPYAVQQGAGMVVTKSDEKKEYAAAIFLKWFTEPEQNVRFASGSGYLPVQVQANDREVIQSAITGSDEPVSEVMKQTLLVGVDMVKDYHLYTNKAFENGTDARAVVNNSLQNKANDDLATIEELVAGGMPRSQAVERFATEENFEQWVAEFRSDLQNTVN